MPSAVPGGQAPAASGRPEGNFRPSAGIQIPWYGALLFVVLAGFWAGIGFTRGVEHLYSDQQHNLAVVLKHLDPAVFPRDLVFDGKDFAGEYIPLYIEYLATAYRLTGNPAAGYQWLVFPLTLLYLFGVYRLFARCGVRRGGAVAIAMLASLPQAVPLSGELFGIGPVQTITARMLFTALFPYLLFWFWSWIDRPRRLIALLFVVGLLANLHPVSGLFLAPILGLVLLARARWKARAWVVVGLMGLATAAGAAPILAIHLQRLAMQAANSAQAGNALVAQMMGDRLGDLLYPPHTLRMLPPLLVDAITLGVTALSAIAMARPGTGGDRAGPRILLSIAAIAGVAYLLYPDGKLLCGLLLVLALLPRPTPTATETEWLAAAFALSTLWVSIGGVLAIQGIFGLLGRPVLFADMIRASRFAGFGVFFLAAALWGTVEWSRLRRPLQIGCCVLALGIGFWQIRDTARTYLRFRGDAAARDLSALSRWAREHTGSGDLFAFDSPGFRVMAQRSVVFTRKDGATALYHRPERVRAWIERAQALREAGEDPEALWSAGVRFGADYVVVPARVLRASDEGRLCYRNGTYAVLSACRQAEDHRGGPQARTCRCGT
jgi:hypothetical protein